NDENEWFQWGVSDTLKERISSLIAARQTAKKDKNFELADSIRSQLGELGVELMDTPAGTVWEKI
ncbi:MAG: cysteine--tRNA ligase, partial [Campylobacter sp.]|nr:cysteine--tRNA ligase [Campylobacter sp.]